MILADTSIWQHHFRNHDARFHELLSTGQILIHPFVIGELACGNLRRRTETLYDLALMPQAPVAGTDEVLGLVEKRRLWGKGLGFVDAHLLASVLLSAARLWTRDRRLGEAAESLGVAYQH